MQSDGDKIELTPLFGGFGQGHCYLLQVDNVRMLLDCGWNEDFDPKMLESLRKVAPTVDLVLISHPDIQHMGALPYAMKEFGLDATVCLTRAAADLGVLTLYDTYISKARKERFDYFDLDTIDLLRTKFNELNFEQAVRIDGSALEVSILRAGRLLGGGVWHIKREPEDILYAVDFNHKKEKHLDGVAFGGGLKPTVLITDTYNVSIRHQPRPKREEQMLEKILTHLRNNGNVLLPVDTTGRVLELLLFLEQEWKKRRLTYNIVWANPIVYSISRHVQTHLEFMEEGLNREFSQHRTNPFNFKHVKLADNLTDVRETRDPKIILCSSGTLEYGFARELFVDFVQHKRNLVLLTDRSMLESSLTRKLYNAVSQHRELAFLDLSTSSWQYFEGEELERWKHQESERGAAEERRKKLMAETKALREELAGEDEDELEFDLEAEQKLNANGKRAGDGELRRSESALFSVSVSKSRKVMFSAPEVEIKWTDYGEEVDEEDFVTASAAAAKANEGKEEAVVEAIKDLTTYDFGDTLRDCSLKSELRGRLPRRVKRDSVVAHLQCDVEYIDFEGRSDWRSIKILVEKLKPRKVVMVNYTEESAAAFAEEMGEIQRLECVKPEAGKPMSIASDGGLWRIKMDRSLFDRTLNPLYDKSLDQTLRLRNNDIAYVEGVVRDLSALGKEYALLEPVDAEELGQTQLSRSIPKSLVSFGELSLLSLQDKISKAGLSSKFKDGVLMCDNNVNIYKAKNSSIQVMGPLCKEYFTLRNLLYTEFQRV